MAYTPRKYHLFPPWEPHSVYAKTNTKPTFHIHQEILRQTKSSRNQVSVRVLFGACALPWSSLIHGLSRMFLISSVLVFLLFPLFWISSVLFFFVFLSFSLSVPLFSACLLASLCLSALLPVCLSACQVVCVSVSLSSQRQQRCCGFRFPH